MSDVLGVELCTRSCPNLAMCRAIITSASGKERSHARLCGDHRRSLAGLAKTGFIEIEFLPLRENI